MCNNVVNTHVHNKTMTYNRRPPQTKRIVNRKKVFVIPYVDNKVMLVKDRKTNEWGFISGGVKNHESYFQAAQRELFEETSGLMPYIPDEHGRSSFKTMYRPDELRKVNERRSEQVASSYCVFWIPIHPKFANTLETSFVPNEEVTQLKVDEYYKFKNRWIVCDMFMDTLVN